MLSLFVLILPWFDSAAGLVRPGRPGTDPLTDPKSLRRWPVCTHCDCFYEAREVICSGKIFTAMPRFPPWTTTLNVWASHEPGLLAESFKGLPNLQHLNFIGNDLREIEPNAFDGLSFLLSLDLSYNPITTLPSRLLSALPRLQYLNLSHTKLKDISDLNASRFSTLLTAPLVELNLASTRLREVSQAPTLLPAVASLQLQDIGIAFWRSEGFLLLEQDIPFGLAAPADLRQLNMTECGTHIETNLTTFSRLEELLAPANILFPLTLQSLRQLRTLRRIDLSYCSISWPDPLTRIWSFSPPSAEYLNLANIGLTGFEVDRANAAPRALDNLTTLILADNQLSRLRGLGRLPSLRRLDLSRNRLVAFPQRNDDIVLHQLTSLDLSGNTLEEIDSEAFDCCPALAELNLSRNRIYFFDANIFLRLHWLENLVVEENELRSLDFLDAPRLRMLWLRGNRLNRLSLSSANMSSLVMLDLSDNPELLKPTEVCTTIEPENELAFAAMDLQAKVQQVPDAIVRRSNRAGAGVEPTRKRKKRGQLEMSQHQLRPQLSSTYSGSKEKRTHRRRSYHNDVQASKTKIMNYERQYHENFGEPIFKGRGSDQEYDLPKGLLASVHQNSTQNSHPTTVSSVAKLPSQKTHHQQQQKHHKQTDNKQLQQQQQQQQQQQHHQCWPTWLSGLGQLRNLDTLSLSNTGLRAWPEEIFAEMPALTDLDLSRNQLSSATLASVFNHTGAFCVQNLNLSANELILMDNVILSYLSNDCLSSLDLSNNLFACDCKLFHLRRFSSKLAGFAVPPDQNSYSCFTHAHQLLLSEYYVNPQSANCPEHDELVKELERVIKEQTDAERNQNQKPIHGKQKDHNFGFLSAKISRAGADNDGIVSSSRRSDGSRTDTHYRSLGGLLVLVGVLLLAVGIGAVVLVAVNWKRIRIRQRRLCDAHYTLLRVAKTSRATGDTAELLESPTHSLRVSRRGSRTELRNYEEIATPVNL